jgi:hypothetical protein
MSQSVWQVLIDELTGAPYELGVVNENTPSHKVKFDAGLTDEEVAQCERKFAFRFPPDLREFLQTALPSGPRFPNWRACNEPELRERLDRPRDGLLFDVEHNGLWLEEWGERPVSLAVALDVASGHISRAPKLIPVFSHRMMPEEPHMSGNPVLSVYQSDIIYYGFDLADYLRHEFALSQRKKRPESMRPIPFWGFFLS